MDNCVPDWNTEFGAEFSLPVEKKPLGLENELMELLWQNGDVVLHNQTSIKQSKQVQPIQDYETISWIDESFEKEFYTNHFSEIPPSNTIEPNKPLEKYDNGKAIKFDTTANSDQNTESIVKNDNNFRLPVKKHEISHVEQDPITECSVKTVNLSHCASNQVVSDIDMHWASSSYGIGGKTVVSGVEVKYGRNASPGCESTDKETLGYGSSFWNQSNETNSHKRKSRDVEESECRSDASELDSGGGSGNKLSQKSGTTRSSRLAEVHNLSERKRRDRINERMKALQELIPHSNKSDKASMLDEAIEYMKSLQWQIQLMWMGGGMAPMMLPGMQPMLPSVQNLMHLSRSPLVDRAVNQEPVGHRSLVNYQNQMQNPSFPEQHANYMGFHTVPSTLQPVNMFDFGFHSAQQNQILQPPDNGNGSIG